MNKLKGVLLGIAIASSGVVGLAYTPPAHAMEKITCETGILCYDGSGLCYHVVICDGTVYVGPPA